MCKKDLENIGEKEEREGVRREFMGGQRFCERRMNKEEKIEHGRKEENER